MEFHTYSSDFNALNLQHANGETISIERLRYLISNISIGTTIKDYNL